MPLPPPTIPSGGALTWASQVAQYPATGPGGISYFAGDVDPDKPPIDCLLLRSWDGRLLGILNHYPVDYPPWEEAGNVNLWIHPAHRRRGLGAKLLRHAMEHYEIDLTAQRFTPEGHALATHLIEEMHDAT